jgi:hypothetical protein
MSYEDSFTIKWDKTDFVKHGYIATYAIGGCRCDKCKQRWEDWEYDQNLSRERRANIRSLTDGGKPRGSYKRRTSN